MRRAGVPGGHGDLGRANTDYRLAEVADGLAAVAAGLPGPIVLDGEIVAVDAAGGALPFERIQGRMHRRGRPRADAPDTAAVFIAFDLIRDGEEDLRPRPFTERRARLVERLDPDAGGVVRVVPSRRGGGADLRDEALANDWEGLIVKEPASRGTCRAAATPRGASSSSSGGRSSSSAVGPRAGRRAAGSAPCWSATIPAGRRKRRRRGDAPPRPAHRRPAGGAGPTG